MAADPVFLDTCFIVAAMVDIHPAHVSSLTFLAQLADEGVPLCTSPQVCREYLVSLTRAPIGEREYSVAEALESLDDWLHAAVLLPEDGSVSRRWEQLVGRYRVRGKQVHDTNIVATMLAHDIRRLVTRNPADFERYLPEGILILGPTTH